jgi:hypothetical protein
VSSVNFLDEGSLHLSNVYKKNRSWKFLEATKTKVSGNSRHTYFDETAQNEIQSFTE